MHNSDQSDHVYDVTPKDRIVERARGCWSCAAFDRDGKLSVDKWTGDRDYKLAEAMRTALEQPDSITAVEKMQRWAAAPSTIHIEEDDDAPTRKIKTVLRMVDKMDHLVAQGAFRLCMRNPAPADRHEATYFAARYLCSGWTGRDGHSLATQGAPLDKLPDELREEKQ
jgi:hypothetical protein